MNARDWLASGGDAGDADVVVLGAPIARASISPSRAWTTPPALRAALARFATWDGDHDVDVSSLRVRDLGDVVGDEHDDDCRAAHGRIAAAVGAAAAGGAVVVVIGGDNSLTLPFVSGMCAGRLSDGVGLVTLDAHHDVRPRGEDGLPRNGTPVRDLIEAGLPGQRVAQVGIHGFANAREHAAWARARGVVVRRADHVRRWGPTAVAEEVLDRLGAAGAERVVVDLDVDVLDRADAPACPASMPGGLRPEEAQELCHRLGADPRVVGLDITEVDASADDAALTTVRFAASALLAFCSGVAARRGGAR